MSPLPSWIDARLGPRRFAVGLCVVVAISVVVDLWWLAHFRGGGYPLDIDESRYLELGLRLSDGLTSGGPAAFWHVWSSQHAFGPLLPLLSVPVFLVVGHSVFAGLATQLVFFVLLVVSSYGIGTRLTSPAGGLLAGVVVACTPAVVDFSRTYQFAIPDAAVLAAATYALLASEAFTRLRWACAWGVLIGLLPLARTMAIAFVPAQLLAAVWLVLVRPDGPAPFDSHVGRFGAFLHLRRAQLLNLGASLVLGALAAGTWLAESWRSVYGYLTNFGYGAQSAHFSTSGSRLSVGYWTREAVNSVRADLYLPLAALLALALASAGLTVLVKRRRRDSHPGGPPEGRRSRTIAFRRWMASDTAIVLLILIEGYLAVTSSRNEGVGFRTPLITPLAALVVAALFTVGGRVPRRLLVGGLVAVCALNLVMKADVFDAISGNVSASVPGFDSVPVFHGEGYIQHYVLGSLEARYVSATQPLPASQRRWLSAYARIDAAILGLARRGHYTPVVDLATDEPLLNANDLTLAARLKYHRDLEVKLLAGRSGATSRTAYRQLVGSVAKHANVLLTVTRVGLSYFALAGRKDIDQGLLQETSSAGGFACGAGIDLPDGRIVIVSWRAPRSARSALPASCSPRVIQTTPSPGASTSTTGPIAVLFSIPMNTATLRPAFRLAETRTGHRIAGTISFFGSSALIFRPARPLPSGTRFTAVISLAATGATGARLKHLERWRFRTRF